MQQTLQASAPLLPTLCNCNNALQNLRNCLWAMDAARRLFEQGQWDEALQNINTCACRRQQAHVAAAAHPGTPPPQRAGDII